MLNHNSEEEYAIELLKETLKESDNDNEVESILQRKMVKGISDIFLPLWIESQGDYGNVSIQGDPVHEEDPLVIIDEGRKNRSMNPNIMIKIPATKAGLVAMEGRIDHAILEHEAIAKAIMGKNPDNAKKMMVDHLDDLKKVILKLMNAFNYING